jgi:H+/gluconate symporter-like permease
VVRRFLAIFGEKRAGEAILVSGYILSIPIFFDTFFMLLLPLARAMALRTGKNYLLYVMAICCGGTVTHSLCAPHPGPLAMAETLKVDLGLTIMVGVVTGLVPTLASWLVVIWLNRRSDFPLRETPGAPIADLKAIMAKREEELPSFFWSILPVILPILLISLASTFTAIQGKGFEVSDFKDPARLAAKISGADDPVSQFLRAQVSEETRQSLAANTMAQSVPLQNALAGELNTVLKAGPIYQPERFAGVPLRESTRRRLQQSHQGDNISRLNRSLIEDAYPQELRPTRGLPAALFLWGEFIGNRNVALLIGAVIAIALLMRQRGISLAQIGELIGPPLETAGVIILITSAGGAFGLMLKNAGVGEAIKATVAGHQVNLILLSWLVAAVIRIAQGSATVAMLTTAAMIYPIMTSGAGLPYHPVYIFMAIGFGAMMLSWMNDSGFWVVGKLSGFTEKETLKSWTVVVSVNSVAGLAVCLLGATLLPFK